MELTISIDDRQVKKKLISLADGIKDFSEPFNKIGSDLIELYSKKVFETKGGAIGDSWKPLSAATLMMRDKRQGYYKQTPIVFGKTLIWTGKLQSGFKKTVSKTKLVISNKVPYFKFHQKAGGKPPQRKMLGLTKGVITTFITEINKYVVSLLQK